MPASQRQEVFNVLLAQLLQERGVIAAPESILYTGAQKVRQMPDVIVNFQGLRTAIEGEVDAADAKAKALALALRRVETGVAHIGIGVVYPAHLRTTDFAELKPALAASQFEMVIVSEMGSTGFFGGGIETLERILRSTFDQLIREDVVAEAVATLDAAVDFFAAMATDAKGVWDRIVIALNGRLPDPEIDGMTAPQRGANCRIGGLVVINAMIFHDILTSLHRELTPLKQLPRQRVKLQDTLAEQWQHILDHINYYSIFHVARQVLISVHPYHLSVVDAIPFLLDAAIKIGDNRAALRHDLMGRVYHRLLSEAKYLGTYYTSIPAATLLLKLALRPNGWPLEWQKVDQVGQLKIADLACGTGTLLMAAAETVLDNYISASANTGQPVKLDAIHQQIAESILHGYDVLASAIHLTASTLALRSLDVPFKKMNLFAVPHGGTDNRLGSIEFLSGNLIQIPLDLSGAFAAMDQTEHVTGTAMEKVNYTTLPELDLCVMNPPFVRSVGGNLLFGSVPQPARDKMQEKLKKLVQKSGVSASITSGLGSVFVAIGDRHIRPGGRLALVLPKALLSGVSWEKTRQLINRKYRLDYVIVSHDAERWNFSESTDLSEVLVIATKHETARPPQDHKVIVVNLWHNPTTELQALAVASSLNVMNAPDLIEGQAAAPVRINGYKAGEAAAYAWKDMQADWFLPCAFAQSDLTRSAYHLLHGSLSLPGHKDRTALPLCPLSDLGKLGPDRRDIHDGFELSEAPTAYPAFWGHDAKTMLTLAQQPNHYLTPLAQSKNNRPLRKVTDLWPLAGRVLLAERMWLYTQRLVAVHLNQPVLSNVWWSFAFKPELAQTESNKVLTLWLNSTLALLVLLATRDETRGAWVDFKKPSLSAMPVLDLRTLSPAQITALAAAYDRVCQQTLQPLPEMASDPVRAEIDQALAQTLQLPDFSLLRTLLGREPVVCMKQINPLAKT